MKRSLIIGILGFAASVFTTFGQGSIALNNYSTSLATGHPLEDVTFGAGFGALTGTGLNNTFTAGLYWAPGNVVSQVASDPDGLSVPTFLYSGFVLATGLGATGGFASLTDTGGVPGEYAPENAFNPGIGGGQTITVMIIAYNTSSYANASLRAHSKAFTMTTAPGTASPEITGNLETDGGFQIIIPEPSALALSGLGAAVLVLVRRKK